MIGSYSNTDITPTLADTEHQLLLPTCLFSVSLLQKQSDVSGQKQTTITAILRSDPLFYSGFKLWSKALSQWLFHAGCSVLCCANMG